jgi:hypothetical protein
MRLFFFMAPHPNSELGHLIFEITISHAIRHGHTPGRTPLNKWSARYLHYTQQTQQMKVRALSGIRTRDTSDRVAEGLCLSPHSHRNPLTSNILIHKSQIKVPQCNYNKLLQHDSKPNYRNVVYTKYTLRPSMIHWLGDHITHSQFPSDDVNNHAVTIYTYFHLRRPAKDRRKGQVTLRCTYFSHTKVSRLPTDGDISGCVLNANEFIIMLERMPKMGVDPLLCTGIKRRISHAKAVSSNR